MADKRICSIAECGKEHYARGWCGTHYRRWRVHGDPLAYKIPPKAICSVPSCGAYAHSLRLCNKHYLRYRNHGSPYEGAFKPKGGCSVHGCDKPHKSKGYCSKHLARWQNKGDPSVGRAAPKQLGVKFVHEQAAQFDRDECLIWPFGKTASGYGVVYINRRQRGAHVYVCEVAHGKSPDPSYEVAHSCGVRACCNPKHLRWASRSDNHADKLAHGTAQRGTRSAMNKLTEQQVREIRALKGCQTLDATARQYGVCAATVREIQVRKIWAWLE